MSFESEFLQRVQQKVQQTVQRDDYVIGFYLGGFSADIWKSVPISDQKMLLKESAPWYIWWKFRNPDTGKLKLFPHIKKGVNRIETVKGRLDFMQEYRKAMIEVFKEGYNPFTYAEFESVTGTVSCKDAIEKALTVKKSMVSELTFNEYTQRAEEFQKFLKNKGHLNSDIKIISRKMVSEYLDGILKRSGSRNRNNHRATLSALFSVLSDSFLIETNFIKNDIPKLRQKRKVDRRFTPEELKRISDYLKLHDPVLLLFLKMVAYNFMRPVEVSRLTVGSVNLQKKELTFDQKTKKGKTKVIPDIYFSDLKELIHGADSDHVIFTPSRRPSFWNISDNLKRDYWSKQFKKVKQATNVETDMYGLRHFYITESYLTLRSRGLSKNASIEKLMLITGHESRSGIENYIHDYDLEKPEDWSDLFDIRL